ncbi:MAG: hypothetical protein WKF92_15970, partial [Pyrinomonadaceae bacterium]
HVIILRRVSCPVKLDHHIQLLKNRKTRVTKKDLKKKYGEGKEAVIALTKEYPEVMEAYRKKKRKSASPPMDHLDIALSDGTSPPDWEKLLEQVITLPKGKKDATNYENAVEQLLTALFYPALIDPIVQHKLHEGRKRIDITYSNVSTTGFFHWLSLHHRASHVFVECKNYTSDVANPELDQLSGRFSPLRCQFGLLVCRSFDQKTLFTKRCIDTAKDGRGFIIPLDDSDLTLLVNERKKEWKRPRFESLKSKFDALVM